MVKDYGIGVKTIPVTEVAILQVWNGNEGSTYQGWANVAVFGGENPVQLAEAEASLRGYTRWSVSEFGVMGVEK